MDAMCPYIPIWYPPRIEKAERLGCHGTQHSGPRTHHYEQHTVTLTRSRVSHACTTSGHLMPNYDTLIRFPFYASGGNFHGRRHRRAARTIGQLVTPALRGQFDAPVAGPGDEQHDAHECNGQSFIEHHHTPARVEEFLPTEHPPDVVEQSVKEQVRHVDRVRQSAECLADARAEQPLDDAAAVLHEQPDGDGKDERREQGDRCSFDRHGDERDDHASHEHVQPGLPTNCGYFALAAEVLHDHAESKAEHAAEESIVGLDATAS